MNNNIKANILISIIIPVYNKEKYLDRCLKSVENQTYKNIEIILVDDGSKDSSRKIIEKHKEIDKRIIVIYKDQNKGAAAARNSALDIAKGDHICFVDGDDYISEHFVEYLLNNIEESGTDLSMCAFSYSDILPITDNYSKKIYEHEEMMAELFKDKIITSHPCRKMYPKKAFNNARFPEDMKVVEDLAADHLFLHNINNCVVFDSPLYVYYSENGENTSSVTAKEVSSSLYRAKANIQRLEFSDKYYPNLSYILIPKVTMFLLSSYAKLRLLSKDNKKDMEYVIDNIKKFIKRIQKSNETPFLYKIVAYSISNNLKFIPYLASKYYTKNNNL